MTITPVKRVFRDYQLDAVKFVLKHRDGNHKDEGCYYTLPTGTGKTRVITGIVEKLLPQGRIMILVHRKELVEQAAAACTDDISDCFVGIVMAERNQCDADVVCATIQTLTPERLQEILDASYRPVVAVIIDEAHHAVKGSRYEQIINQVRMQFPHVSAIGCTATDFRNDAHTMQDILPHCVYTRSIKEMQKRGVLCPIKWKGIKIPADFSLLATSMKEGEKDYQDKALYDLLAPLTAFIVSKTMRELGMRPFMVFSVNVAHAYELAEAYRLAGFTCQAIDGKMQGARKKEREQILLDWKAGKIQGVVNCGILTEGFDYSPLGENKNGLGAIVIAKPTLSPSLYLQMLGRGTRLKPVDGDFADCLVFDLASNANLLDTKQITLPKLFPLVKEEEEGLDYLVFDGKEDEKKEAATKRPFTYKIRDGLDISWMSWGHAPKSDIFYANLGTGCYTAILPCPTGNGLYHGFVIRDTLDRRKEANRGKDAVYKHEAVTDDPLPLHELMHHINHLVARFGYKKLVDKNANWRFNAPSVKMLEFLERLNAEAYTTALEYKWNAGQVSQSINWYLLRPELAKIRKELILIQN